MARSTGLLAPLDKGSAWKEIFQFFLNSIKPQGSKLCDNKIIYKETCTFFLIEMSGGSSISRRGRGADPVSDIT